MAAKARRLARSLSATDDRERLLQLAEEQDAMADALEAGASAAPRSCPCPQPGMGDDGRATGG
jgi:hypothetical protein